MAENVFVTNSLSSANFDILKMDGVEDPLININRLATMDFEESYTSKVVDFINECRKELLECKITFYKSLNEATSEQVVHESFSDFFTGVKNIISKFIKFLHKLVDRFVVMIMKLVKSDQYIKKNKALFDKLEADIEFTYTGYEYTFSPSIPSPAAALSYNASLFDELYANDQHNLTADSVKSSIIAMDLERDYDDFRGKVIGKDGTPISISEFSQELYKVYRNGRSDTDTITADISHIRRCLNRFLDYTKMKSEVEHQKNDIIKAYEKVQSQIKDITKRNTDLDKQAFLSRLPSDTGITDVQTTGGGTLMAAELMTQIDAYVHAKIDQIQEYSNIHLIAFGAKLDAMKECMLQDKAVLYTALKKTKVPFEKKKR